MSYVEVFQVKENGDVISYGEASNNHGYAPLVWDILGNKHLETYSMFNPSTTEKLWDLFGTEKLTRDENVILGSTLDRVWIKKEIMPELIRILREFYDEHLNDKVLTMRVAATILEKMLSDKDTIGCAFNQCSACEAFWRIYDAEEEDQSHYNVLTGKGEAWELSEALNNT